MVVLVTGGAGYIGSHTVISLLDAGYEVIVLDNLSNSSSESLRRVKYITGKEFDFIIGDVANEEILKNIFSTNNVWGVIHFAGSKSVSESNQKPLEYYDNNFSKTINLLAVMKEFNVNNFIFSSSATVYGNVSSNPINENFPIGGTTNPYGTSKYMVEVMLKDYVKSQPNLNVTALRYFNPVGAHSSGMIGEDPNGVPNNLLPYITQVACGKLKKLYVYGDDYPTKDGTGVRDYIHVMDLAEGHVSALNNIDSHSGYRAYNLGTGKGYSVLDMINTFIKITGIDIPYEVISRRVGDIAECWSDPSLAFKELSWRAGKDLENMIYDAWNWQRNNPEGY